MNIVMNNINMTSVGGTRIKSGPTPKMRTYEEGHFMKKSPLAKDYVAPEKNIFKKAFNSVLKLIKNF